MPKMIDTEAMIACLKANPEACAEVKAALLPLTMAGANATHDRAEQAERERDEARAEVSEWHALSEAVGFAHEPDTGPVVVDAAAREAFAEWTVRARRAESDAFELTVERDALKAKLAEAERELLAWHTICDRTGFSHAPESGPWHVDAAARESFAEWCVTAARDAGEVIDLRAKLAEAEARCSALARSDIQSAALARLRQEEIVGLHAKHDLYRRDVENTWFAKTQAAESRASAAEAVVEAARQWAEQDSLYHRHSGSGRKADVLDALRALDAAQLGGATAQAAPACETTPEPAGTWLQMHGCTVDVDEDAGDYWDLCNAIAATCARRGVSVFLDNARVQVRRGPSADGVAFLPNFCNFRQQGTFRLAPPRVDPADLTEEPITRAERAAREKAESRASAAEAKLAALSALIHTESGLDDHRYTPEQMVTEMAARWQGASDDCEAAERVVEAAVRWRNARAACLGIRDAADALASATWVWEAHSPVGVAATAEGPGPGPLCAQCGAPIGYCRDVCGRERQLSVSNGQTPEPAGTTATEEWTTNDDLNADACEGIAGATPATLSDLAALEERIVCWVLSHMQEGLRALHERPTIDRLSDPTTPAQRRQAVRSVGE